MNGGGNAASGGQRGHVRNVSDGVTPQQKDTIFAVFAKTNTYIFRAKSEREKIEWILRIDQGYFSSGEGREVDGVANTLSDVWALPVELKLNCLSSIYMY